MSKLFSEYDLKNIRFKNRIVMPPMCMYSANDDGLSNKWHHIHYASRAVGGAGLIIFEATAVERRGRISNRDLGIWDDRHVENLKMTVDACKIQGAKVGIQLGHAGRKCEAPDEAIIAPSAIPFNDKSVTPKAMDREDINMVIEAFKQGARRAREAGFDVLEIHGAHGYLINAFLSPLTNKRTDEYGGSPENRVRFLREIIEAIRSVWPQENVLMLRVSAEEYHEVGNHPEDIAEMINLVKDAGIDLIDVSSGGVVEARLNLYPGYQIKFAEIIKEKTGLPVVGGGLVTKAEMAEEMLQNNRIDFVFLGRELLRNPYWPLQSTLTLKSDMAWPEQYFRSK